MDTSAQCKNCGASLAGAYCGTCGQIGDVSIPSLWAVIADAVGDLFNFDARIWRSLVLLVLRPGRLTLEYLQGRRARYVPPFRMYLVLSLLFFVLTSLPGGDGDAAAEDTARSAEPPPASGGAQARGRAGAAAAVPEPVPGTLPDPDASEARTPPGSSGWDCNEADIAGLGPGLQARFRAACEAIKADSGASFSRAFLDNIPLMMFLFIPVVATIMKGLYPLAGKKYVEHLLFLLHFHAFFFLLAGFTWLASSLAGLLPMPSWPVTLLLVASWLYLPAYLFVAMRRVYGQGRIVTAIKYALLGAGYFTSLAITFGGVGIYTALTL